jgi:putative FmdB family regulatory protein
MPTYQYQCTNCSYEFEEFQQITEDPIKVCPKCKGKVKRLITGGSGLLFKGSGFYITDYRSDSYKSAAKKDSTDALTSSAKKSDSKSDGKKSA